MRWLVNRIKWDCDGRDAQVDCGLPESLVVEAPNAMVITDVREELFTLLHDRYGFLLMDFHLQFDNMDIRTTEIRLRNGAALILEERLNGELSLAVGTPSSGNPRSEIDYYICSVSVDGVHVLTNTGDACLRLASAIQPLRILYTPDTETGSPGWSNTSSESLSDYEPEPEPEEYEEAIPYGGEYEQEVQM